MGSTGNRVLWYSGLDMRIDDWLPEFDSWGIRNFSQESSNMESGMFCESIYFDMADRTRKSLG